MILDGGIQQLTDGPSWPVIAVSLIGVLFTISAAYIKSLERRVAQNEKDLSDLNKLVLRDYHNKEELNRLLSQIQNSVGALHRRFDAVFSQAGFNASHRDGNE